MPIFVPGHEEEATIEEVVVLASTQAANMVSRKTRNGFDKCAKSIIDTPLINYNFVMNLRVKSSQLSLV